MNFAFEAFVTEILADGAQAAFALGDGTVAWDDGARIEAHNGAILCAARHPSGVGVITGGDDGRLVWSRAGGEMEVLARAPGRWIDALAGSPAAGLIAFAAGREAHVLGTGAPDVQRTFVHPASVSGLAFDPKGRRLAAATYGGVALWYARVAEQKPVMLRWGGSHVGVIFSPDGKFVVSTMQEPVLHGWRLSDTRDMRLEGYPSKVRGLAFVEGPQLATSGANGVVLWPFSGAGGPMGKRATELGHDGAAQVTRVAADAKGGVLVAGLDDGRIWSAHLATERRLALREDHGAPISALAVLADGRVAWGDEAGAAGILQPA